MVCEEGKVVFIPGAPDFGRNNYSGFVLPCMNPGGWASNAGYSMTEISRLGDPYHSVFPKGQ